MAGDFAAEVVDSGAVEVLISGWEGLPQESQYTGMDHNRHQLHPLESHERVEDLEVVAVRPGGRPLMIAPALGEVAEEVLHARHEEGAEVNPVVQSEIVQQKEAHQ